MRRRPRSRHGSSTKTYAEPEFEFDGDELGEEESAEESAVGSDEEEASDDGTARYPDSVVDSVESRVGHVKVRQSCRDR